MGSPWQRHKVFNIATRAPLASSSTSNAYLQYRRSDNSIVLAHRPLGVLYDVTASLSCSHSASTAFERVGFFSFRFVYTATSKSCCWDYSVLLVFLPRSLAFVRRLFLVRCQTDHKKLENLLLYNSKRHSSLKPICNYAPLRYACIAELQDPELCWVRQCLVWVWVWDTSRYYCGLKIHYNQTLSSV